MNPSLERAIQEAMLELDRQMSDQSKGKIVTEDPAPTEVTIPPFIT